MVLLKGNAVKTSLIHADSKILEKIAGSNPALIAVDPPLSLPEKGESFRKTDREMIRKGL